ncbi:hypothetical protein ACSVH5_04530 [Flavobacterium sp. RSSA_27]|uniref:AsmA family protein n=1 Tax=Flavobacterium sp. RSSA_27 TaxID=3447667 RepID=UPI003F3CD727
MANKWLSLGKKIGKIFLLIAILLLSIYGIIGLYVNAHHDELLKEVREIADKNCNGEVKIGDLEVLFFRGFPNVTIAIKDVSIKDSLWAQHKKTLLKAPSIYAEILPWAIFVKKIKLENISINDATIDLYVGKDGYSNSSVFSTPKKNNKESSSGMLTLELNHLSLKNVHFISENQSKFKKFDFNIFRLQLVGAATFSGWEGNVQLETQVKSMAFNTRYGSFAKNKIIKGKLTIQHQKNEDVLLVDSEALAIGEDVFQIHSKFGLTKTNTKYLITIINPDIAWDSAYNLLSNNISSKLKTFKLSPNFDVQCDIDGDFNLEGDPYIHVITHMKNTALSYFKHKVTEASFMGEFTNRYKKNIATGDQNSAVILHDFRGKTNGIPFKTKQMMILNFEKPIASGYLETRFDMVQLNATPLKEYFKFSKGKAAIQVLFKADVIDLEMKKPYLIGVVNFDHADYTYVPSNTKFHNTTVDLEFTPKQLKVNSIIINTKNSAVTMNGYSDNFMNLYYDDPQKIFIYWKAKAKKLTVDDFYSGESPNKPTSNNTNTSKKSMASTLDQDFFSTLHQSKGSIDLIAEELIYKKFKAKNAITKIRVANDSITLQQASLAFGHGKLNLNGSIVHAANHNSFSTSMQLQNVDIQEVLYAFNNFGSKTITYKNIEGKLTITSSLTGAFTRKGDFISQKATGNLLLQLNNGELIQFDPIKNVGKYAFPFRDFNRVKIEPLQLNIKLKNGIAQLQPTPISSSVLNLDIAGLYGFNGQTNLQVDVHLRDPEKDKGITNKKVIKENRKKGITLHLQAVDDEKGNIKIKLRGKNEKLQ